MITTLALNKISKTKQNNAFIIIGNRKSQSQKHSQKESKNDSKNGRVLAYRFRVGLSTLRYLSLSRNDFPILQLVISQQLHNQKLKNGKIPLKTELK